MIRVNLAGGPKKQSTKSSRGFGSSSMSLPVNLLPVLLIAIVVGTVAGGYLWYSGLSSSIVDLDSRIAQATAQKAQLEGVIKQNQIYETRKKDLENRINIIEGLKRNQVSPVVSVDALADAINKTQFVWLSSVDQNNTVVSMSGTGTSVNALADFVSNLEGTGYFRNINLVNAQDSAGNYTFSMTCEFMPPPGVLNRTAAAPTPERGAN
jgi:Tfp pilus assembly protein PilN